MKLFILLIICFHSTFTEAYLKVNGKSLMWNGKKIFLNGANIAWNELNNDYGNGKYFQHRNKMNEWLKGVSSHGGNTVRIWLHCSGNLSPQFDKNGYVIGTDKNNQLISELKALLDEAAKHNVFVILCMFCTSIFKTDTGFINDEKKIESYIEKALKPMIEGLKGKKALAAWELMNEPEGGMDLWYKDNDTHTCFDLQKHFKDSNKGMGFELKNPVKKVLRFFNWVSDAIHRFDSEALVTVGTWNWKSGSNKCWGCFNLYTDECMKRAGGKDKGTLDFYQMHTYEWLDETPLKKKADFYGLDRPLIIGEFSVKRSGGIDAATAYKHYYFGGYNGALAWQYNDHNDNDRDSRDVINKGMSAIRNEHSNGEIKVIIN